MSDASNNSLVQSAEPAAQVTLAGLKELWQQTQGDPGICIALLDGAVDLSHPALAGARITQHDVLGRAGEADKEGREHGTHVASIIFGRHEGPVKGVAPHCSGIVIPIYNNRGGGISCSQKDLAKAINEAIRLGAQIINISGGERSRDGSAAEELRLAIRNCVDEDRVIVAAAGNDGCQECLHIPGAVPSVLAVGALGSNGEPLPCSNWGEIYRLQGIVALGQDIFGAIPNGGVAARSGTSFAAATVSGIAGLLLSLQKKRGMAHSPFLVREALVRTAQGCEGQVSTACDRLLAGRLNVSGAVQFLTQGVHHMSNDVTSAQSGLVSDTYPPSSRLHEPLGTVAAGGRAMPDIPQHESGNRVPPSVRPRATSDLTATAADAITPADCGCGGQKGAKQKVYVIGELDFDVVSPARRDSLQQNAPGLPPGFGFENAIETRAAFLRYLLGINFSPKAKTVPEALRAVVDEARRENRVNGNFYDAESVYWVLKQGECPMYVIRPQGAFAAAAYHQLAIFLIEQTFVNSEDFALAAINEHCLDEFYPCYGGTQEPFRDSLSRPETVSSVEARPKPQRAKGQSHEESETEGGASQDFVNQGFTLFNEPAVSASHVAIAGDIVGTARLFSGEEVEVICPVMRGMQNWNTRRLIELLLNNKSLNIAGHETEVAVLVLKIVSRLYELARNPGKDPCDRAKNYMATKELFNITSTLMNPVFLSMLGAFGPPAGESDPKKMAIDTRQFFNVTLDNLQCKPARCVRYGSEPYEVELSYYNFANQFMGSVVVSQTIDVSDVVPVPLERPRVFTRRS